MTSQNTFRPSTKAEIKADMVIEMEAIIGDVSPELLAELAPMFLQDAPPLLSALEKGVTKNDLQLVCEAAHTLKGSSSSMGIKRLSQLASRMEQCAKQSQTCQLPIHLNHLQAEYAQVVEVLCSYVQE